MNNLNILEDANKKFILLFTLILAMFSGWSPQLLPGHMIKHFDNNRVSQLLVLFALIFFTLNLLENDDESTPILNKLKTAIILFFGYIIITKQSSESFILTVVLFGILTIISQIIKSKKNIVDEENNDSKESENNSMKMLERLNNLVILVTLTVVFVGFSKYFMKQYNDHRKTSSSFAKFLLKFLFEGSKDQQLAMGTTIL
tara:strand:- start:43 stop:645 length:603 start_codon:yes stop_codon:yes gene_type:complete